MANGKQINTRLRLKNTSKNNIRLKASNLRRCNQLNSKHKKTIVIAQIIAFENFENYGSIELMKKLISLFNYRNFPNLQRQFGV